MIGNEKCKVLDKQNFEPKYRMVYDTKISPKMQFRTAVSIPLSKYRKPLVRLHSWKKMFLCLDVFLFNSLKWKNRLELLRQILRKCNCDIFKRQENNDHKKFLFLVSFYLFCSNNQHTLKVLIPVKGSQNA